MRTLRIVFSAAMSLGLALAVAPAALGASATQTATPTAKTTTSAKPVDAAAGGTIDVQIWPQLSNTAVITVVDVDPSIKLPFTVRIPVPPGSGVEWVGEILGSQAASDLKQPYDLLNGRGGTFAQFTLTRSHRGQVDTTGFPLTIADQTVTLSVDYVQAVESSLTAISVRLPADISKVKISPKPDGKPVINADGESLYTISPRPFKLGEKQTVDISYSTVPPVTPAPGSQLTPWLIGLALALVVAVIVVLVLFNRQAKLAIPVAQNDATDDEDEDEVQSDDEGQTGSKTPRR